MAVVIEFYHDVRGDPSIREGTVVLYPVYARWVLSFENRFVSIVELGIAVFADAVMLALQLADVLGREHDVPAFVEPPLEVPREAIEEFVEVVLHVVGGQIPPVHDLQDLLPDLGEGFGSGHLLDGEVGVLEDP